MIRLVAPASIASLILLAGCASRSERDALRRCHFAPRATHRIAASPDSMVVILDLEIHNPGPTAAILDSFQATASTDKPLARLSHGLARRIDVGHTDTVALRFSMANQNLLATAFTFMVSPPDSIGLDGNAWVPGPFGWWTSQQRFTTRIPFQAVSARINEIFHASPPSP